jgi:hypothetical protein
MMMRNFKYNYSVWKRFWATVAKVYNSLHLMSRNKGHPLGHRRHRLLSRKRLLASLERGPTVSIFRTIKYLDQLTRDLSWSLQYNIQVLLFIRSRRACLIMSKTTKVTWWSMLRVLPLRSLKSIKSGSLAPILISPTHSPLRDSKPQKWSIKMT